MGLFSCRKCHILEEKCMKYIDELCDLRSERDQLRRQRDRIQNNIFSNCFFSASCYETCYFTKFNDYEKTNPVRRLLVPLIDKFLEDKGCAHFRYATRDELVEFIHNLRRKMISLQDSVFVDKKES